MSVIGKVLKFASARRLRREGGIIRPMIKFTIFYYINPIKKQFDTTMDTNPITFLNLKRH